MYGFFWHCLTCGVLWHGPVNSTCWLCGGPGAQCKDDFVYTAQSMNGMTTEEGLA